MKLFAVGDIHGHIEELKDVTHKIVKEADNKESKLIFLGDYIDRGPDSAAVISYVSELKSHPPENMEVITLRGNHEQMALFDKLLWRNNGAYETMQSYIRAGYNNIPIEHEDFMKRTRRIYQYEDYVFVHAGINPEFEIENQTEDTLLWSRNYVFYFGDYRRNEKVIHGHSPFQYIEHPIRTNNTINVDTHCYERGILSAIMIEDDKFSYITNKKPHFTELPNFDTKEDLICEINRIKGE